MSTEHNGMNHMVFERTWLPIESQMHMPNSTLLPVLKKEASILHLNLPVLRFFHLMSISLLTAPWFSHLYCVSLATRSFQKIYSLKYIVS